MPLVRWRQYPANGSAWVADPVPEYRLAAWRGERGWKWILLGSRGETIAQQFYEPDLDTAKAAAEKFYRGYTAARSPAR